MGGGERFEPVLIERRGERYELIQGGELLLAVPVGVFESYEPEVVFPLSWPPHREEHPVRRFFWHPETRTFLMAGLEAHPARTVEGAGTASFRSHVQGFWLPSPPTLFTRPHWNPADPYDAFDARARERSFDLQRHLVRILDRLRPPAGRTAVLNATAPYLEALGVTAPADPEPDAILELSLTPPAPLEDEGARGALHALATGHVGTLFPVLRGAALVGVHALSLAGMHTAEGLLSEWGLLHQQGPYRPH